MTKPHPTSTSTPSPSASTSQQSQIIDSFSDTPSFQALLSKGTSLLVENDGIDLSDITSAIDDIDKFFKKGDGTITLEQFDHYTKPIEPYLSAEEKFALNDYRTKIVDNGGTLKMTPEDIEMFKQAAIKVISRSDTDNNGKIDLAEMKFPVEEVKKLVPGLTALLHPASNAQERAVMEKIYEYSVDGMNTDHDRFITGEEAKPLLEILAVNPTELKLQTPPSTQKPGPSID